MSKKIKGRTPNPKIFGPHPKKFSNFFFSKKSLYVEKCQGSDPKPQNFRPPPKKNFKNFIFRYLQMQSNGDLQKVIQGHPRSRKVKNRYFSKNSRQTVRYRRILHLLIQQMWGAYFGWVGGLI